MGEERLHSKLSNNMDTSIHTPLVCPFYPHLFAFNELELFRVSTELR